MQQKNLFTGFYPSMKVPSYRPLNNTEIKELGRALQIFSDCYLVSSVRALAKTADGQNILKNNIKISDDSCKSRFKINFFYPEKKDIFVTQGDINLLEFTDKYKNPVKLDREESPILKALEIAMDKLIKEHPSAKPFICRIAGCNEKFEYNIASHFMKILTGKVPYSLNEKSLSMSLRRHKKETYDLFERLGEEKDFNFTTGTGLTFKRGFRKFHYYIVDNVDLKKRIVELLEPRTNEIISLSFENAIKSLKSFTGFFKGDLINH